MRAVSSPHWPPPHPGVYRLTLRSGTAWFVHARHGELVRRFVDTGAPIWEMPGVTLFGDMVGAFGDGGDDDGAGSGE